MASRVDMGGYTLIENASLAHRNTLRVDARAKLLAEIRDASKLPELLNFPAVRDNRLLVLGEGSNMLFTGDFDGTVLAMATRGVQVESDGDSARIAVAAGERWDDFVRWTLGQGYRRPGKSDPDSRHRRRSADPEHRRLRLRSGRVRRERRGMGHPRTSGGHARSRSLRLRLSRLAVQAEPGRYIVTAVRFLLPRSRPLRTDYAGIEEQLARMGVDNPAPFHVAEAVVHLRTSKLPDPSVIGNAGSFFKNPIVDAALAEQLKRDHPCCRSGRSPMAAAKLSAAWLIEAAGFQGPRREGDAGISNRHALGAGESRQSQRSATVGVGADV
jgi:UDP-N-acetylmuramate dehydrogenase